MSATASSEPVWIREDVVRAIHRRQLAEHGGRDGVADAALLATILRRPQNLFHPHGFSLAELAACYGYGIAIHRPFHDGNIRTALVVMQLFLARNGWVMAASPIQLHTNATALAAGTRGEADLAWWIGSHLQPRGASAPMPVVRTG